MPAPASPQPSLGHPADVRLARAALAIYAVAFPAWGLVLWWMGWWQAGADALDPLEPRLLVAMLAGGLLVLSYSRPRFTEMLPGFLTAVASVAALVSVALAFANPEQMLYQWHLVAAMAAGALVLREPLQVTWFWTLLTGALLVGALTALDTPTAFPFLIGSGGILFILHGVVAIRENTLQDQILERTTLLREIFLNATDSLFLLHPETGQILLANQRAADMFAVPELDLLLDRDIFAFPARPLTEDEVQHIWDAGRDGDEYRLEVPFKRYEGRPFWGDAAWRRIEIGDRIYTLLRITRIDERIAAQRALVAARDAAEAATAAKSNFLASMSHEIRTPLNGVLGLASLLQQTELSEEQQTYVGTLITSGRTLISLIDELLDFSRVEAGALQIHEENFDLTGCLEDLQLLFRAQAETKQLHLVFDVAPNVPRMVRVDGKRLKQVLVNLLGNAIKFTPSGSVTLKARLGDVTSDRTMLQFTVEDTGIGIPPDDLPELFQPFRQGDPGISRQYGGTGLGLAISKSIADRLGGRLTAESDVGAGSTFVFEIPARRLTDTEAEPQAAAASDVPVDRLRPVLVAEDNEVNRMVIVAMLSRLGCDVDTAHDGAQAIDLATQRTYDVVFMDMMMPGTDGLEATRRLREMELARRPYIIALTASVLPGDRERCIEAGMDDFIAKPVQLENVEAALHRADEAQRFGVAPG